MSKVAEKREFQAEVKQLLDLMVHSLYSNKDVFLRELISNSSDALDKVRFESLTNEELKPEGELSVQLEVDASARTLSVVDNGIGMSKEELLANIGTIAKSGTKEFLKVLQESKEENRAVSPELIGQFGVGFYASFMVADSIRIFTRKAGESSAWAWESSGDGTYSVEEGERATAGTTVTLHLKEADPEDGLKDYCDEFVVRSIVKKYSDFVGYPIRLEVQGKEEDEDQDKESDDEKKNEPINSMKAIWARSKDEVTEEEYKEFYKHISHDWNDPLVHVSLHIEGAFEARALLYIPSKAPFDLYHRENAHRGVQLYVKRVFIMDDCEELMPVFLRFVRGVVDAEDLSLNVSREILQQDRQIRAIRKRLVKRIFDLLTNLCEEDRGQYLEFWGQFGPVVKEGLLDPETDKEKILELSLFSSTHDESDLTTLAEYEDRMREGQKSIYYLAGESRTAIERSPHLEAFKAKGFEVLLCSDRVDEVWLDNPTLEYRGLKLVSVSRGEVELGTEEEKEKAKEELEEKQSELKDLLGRIRAILQDEVKDVRLSSRLTESPACLVTDEGEMTPQLEALLRQTGQEVPKVKRILEINPGHGMLPKLKALFEGDAQGEELQNAAWLLYGQSVLAEGGKLDDPAEFGRRVADLMEKAF